ncbi:callose synthase 7 isoform X2 [Pyrus x bretschneideri]|uniref:callose synthase 7 isoform X2 n=1 Tax=Pyrus x bretschneideri TaxID=225117 RepID=UPI00202F5C84|nr:callose synthase 7 isoform X2 [Pyrus x bretschneideri]
MASSSGTKNDFLGPPQSSSRAMTTRALDDALDSIVVPPALDSIAPIFRVADEIEKDNPRVAYLCRFHGFEKANMMDPTSSGRGVRPFKTLLLHKLERDEVDTKHQLARSDPQEILKYYRQFYEKNIKDGGYTKKPEEMAKNCQIARVLYDVLMTLVPQSQIDKQTLKMAEDVQKMAEDVKKKKEQYVNYNILPLYTVGVQPAIMELPEIKAARRALQNVNSLPMPIFHVKSVNPDDSSTAPTERIKPVNDILDWLSYIFGFQKGNVANQREHLLLLLANMDVRHRNLENFTELNSATIQQLSEKIFKNYRSWFNYLHCKSNIRFPPGEDRQELELIYIALYLLIWGEASNIRFMPECLCYIFHQMAKEVYGILSSNAHPANGETYETTAREEESFLKDVVTPIYQVLYKAKRNKNGKASHSRWRNYDDLNEYFWSDSCFRLGWPMDPKADFFRHSDGIQPTKERPNQAAGGRRKPKTNFVEVRTFWHLYRSFDRMWIFLILAFQALLIVAWSPSGSLTAFFDADVFRSVLSIFITNAFLNLLQATLDIILSWHCWKSLEFTQKLRYLLKFAVAGVWAVVLPIGYSSSVQSPTGLLKFFSSWSRDWRNQSFYNYAVALYLLPNILAAVLLFLPPLRRHLDRSSWRIVTLFMWWAQPKMYVGRGLHEDVFSLLKYTLFWIMLLISKLSFSYYVEILPLVAPTKIIMEMPISNYRWHEFFPNVTHNIGVVIAIWAPIVLVYFMDGQIWYAIFSTIFGGIHGAFSRVGEIRTLGMLRSRFESVPSAFSNRLMPSQNEYANKEEPNEQRQRKNIANFSHVWNEFITSMRGEDLISNRDRDLLLVPYSSGDVSVVQWPPSLLASKIPIALDMARHFKGKADDDLFRKIKNDGCMYSAVTECYETLKDIIYGLLEDEADKMIVKWICSEVDSSIQQHRFLTKFRMSGLPFLSERLENFLKLLLVADEDDDNVYSSMHQIINVLQDIMEIITQDVMINGREILEAAHHIDPQNVKREQKLQKLKIGYRHKDWREKVVRLHLILTVKESAINVPQNLEARRRITFFANSLFMNMPRAPKVRDMLSFSVLTPYYKEDVLYSDEELIRENEDGISILFYLQKIYPDEWTNFKERLKEIPEDRSELTRQWVSYRAQTLSRTVRGMMYYRKALDLQCVLETAGDSDFFGGYQTLNENAERAFRDRAQALADLKFTYVLSCQVYGAQKNSNEPRDRSCYINILKLMLMYPSLRVAYIDTTEEQVNGKPQKTYFSVLVKGGDKWDEEIYRIKLPGPPTDIGEGRPENQNHAIIFTRGEALQTIDMNQDNYFEEAFKMRNVLEEFQKHRRGNQKPTILGLREHIFTGSVSSVALFTSNQETSFATIGQRILANPLRVRFHYGHPDIFDRIFHITRGGISKASKVINLSDDIFAGYNSTMRGGFITHHEYIQVGKGRDVGMNQISLFGAKVSNGNGEQTLSRDVYRLGRQFDFFRMLSFYFTTIGFYFSSMVTVLAVYVFLYGRMYMVMSGLEKEIMENPAIHENKAFEEALAAQSVFQLGLLLVLPMVMEIGLEKGFRTALGDFVIMQLQLASVFFTFQLGTKAHYYGRKILHGGSKYHATGHGFVVHAKFSENYRLYSRSHFVKGLEVLILLIVFGVYGESYRSSNLFRFIIFSMWFLVASWLFAPFIFNPSSFDWQKIVDDWTEWNRWMGNRGRIGISPDKSWESWWDEEQEHLKYTGFRGRILEIILALRFLIYQYVIVYHLDIAHHSKSLLVYGLSWVVMVTVLLVLMIVSMGGRRFGPDFHLRFRILETLLFLGFMSVLIVLFVVCGLTISDLFAAIPAFLPTGWALLLIGQACRPVFRRLGFWESIKELGRAYDYIMGLVIFTSIAILSWFPFVSEFQTRILFNQAFSRGLQISRILAGRRDKTASWTET